MRHVASTAWTALALAGALSCVSTFETARQNDVPADARAGHGGDDRPPLSPAEALAAFQIEPGYRIDLVAAEPLVQDPVAMAFDEDGRLYVAENRGYPDPLDGAAAPPQGVIARLTDTTGDGRYDTRTEFATGLTYPNGIMVWDGGVFVTCAPDLLYLKDTTGDGIADERRVVLTGFNATRTAQIRFSHPTLGPDHWVYLTSGLNGGRVVAPERPGQPAVEFTSSDSRFNPRTQAFELTGGQGQYGLTFDDHGRRFICANRHPVWHVVLEPRELRRNPHLAFSDAVQEVSTVGAQAVVWPLSPDLTTASFHPTLMSTPHAGTFTSASGVHVHRGDAMPAGHEGSLFICESAQNLVQRQVREPAGVSFRSQPARQGAEFLASPDSWFSPVFAANGPDGALYIVDMYRKDIDHPQYVPEPSRRLFDFTAGRDRGRIYRIASTDRPPGGAAPNLGQASTDGLVSALAHPNAWWRETAQRLLVERGARDAVPALRALADASEMARLHALWTLDGLAALRDEDIVRALQDVHAGVRENAVRLAEDRIGASAVLVDHVLARHLDEAPTVRLRAAIALGHVKDSRAVDALAAIARRDGDDRWMRAAVLSGIGGRTQAFFEAFVAAPASSMAARAAVMADLGQVFGAAETPERCVALIAEIADPSADVSWQPAALAGLARGLRARGLADAGQPALLAVLSNDTPRAREARGRLDTLLARGAALAGRDDAPLDVRLSAIELLGQAGWTDAGPTLVRLLDPQQPTAVQVAAVQAIGQHRDPLAAASLVDPGRWQAYTPQVREVVLTTLLAEDRLVHALLDAIERRAVQASAIAPSRRTRLTSHRDATIQQRARTLLSSVDEGDRMRAYERLRDDVLARQGVAERGAGLFTTHCIACHSFDREGGRLGPDLTGIRNQPGDALLLHVLVPDYEITPGYDAYTVETRDGRTIFGRLESESPTSLTLRDAAAQAHVILRADVTSMAAAGTSLMPAGLEEVMNAQALADLIAYLKSPPR